MNEWGLWELFFATGLPEAYLAASQCRWEGCAHWEEPAETAFQPRVEEV